MIKIEDGQLIFKSHHPVQALKDISFSVEKGEWITILGPSGSGKTTLLNVIGGTEQLTDGNVEVSGQDLKGLSNASIQEFRRNTIGYIYQDFRLFNQYSVLENVMMPQWPYLPKKELEQKAKGLLNQLQMKERLHHLPGELSGGEKQRVAIARALLNEPDILLCDEPTGNLDTENRLNIMNVLTQLYKKGMTILVVTHDLELVHYGTRELHMRDGLLKERK